MANSWLDCLKCREYYLTDENWVSIREAVASCAIEGNPLTVETYMQARHEEHENEKGK